MSLSGTLHSYSARQWLTNNFYEHATTQKYEKTLRVLASTSSEYYTSVNCLYNVLRAGWLAIHPPKASA